MLVFSLPLDAMPIGKTYNKKIKYILLAGLEYIFITNGCRGQNIVNSEPILDLILFIHKCGVQQP